jgi:hypothetical protein
MSRSVRKPWYTDGYKGSKRRQYFKKYFNHVIRRISPFDDVLSNGRMFRKMNDTWSICDYKFLHDPKPRIYNWNGEFEMIEPSPIWRVARK